MNQLKSRIVSSLSSLPQPSFERRERATRRCPGKFRVPPLCAKLLSNTLSAAHLTFISLMFDKCLSTAAAGARA